jgi:hypothetical protein
MDLEDEATLNKKKKSLSNSSELASDSMHKTSTGRIGWINE